jgi:acetyl-CoA carboxylase biotin carboxyl carrier protein
MSAERNKPGGAAPAKPSNPAAGPGAAGRPTVDKAMIRELADLLAETGLNEIEWSAGGVQVRVSRGVAAAHAVAALPAASAPGAAAAAAPAAHDGPTDYATHPGAVKSPMVGTAYHASEPGAKPFVQVGDEVKEGQTLLIIEAMKTMNQIPAPRAGRVSRILVSNLQPVEFGQVLIVLE